VQGSTPQLFEPTIRVSNCTALPFIVSYSAIMFCGSFSTQMGKVVTFGVTGGRAKFSISLPQHALSFTSHSQDIEANMPSSASIDLPPMHMDAEYRPHIPGDSSEVLSDHRYTRMQGSCGYTVQRWPVINLFSYILSLI